VIRSGQSGLTGRHRDHDTSSQRKRRIETPEPIAKKVTVDDVTYPEASLAKHTFCLCP